MTTLAPTWVAGSVAGAVGEPAPSAAEPRGNTERLADEAGLPRQPNILIIYADQHRTDCLGAYGNREIRTPNIDALAADGVRFQNSFCAFPVCTPSRYSLLSGLYVHEHRGRTNRCTLPPGTDTFPALLKRAGYRTAAVGKMHFSPTYLDVGFEQMILAEQDGPGRWDDDYHRELRREGLVDVNDLEDQVAEFRAKARPDYWPAFGALPSNLPRKWHSTEWIAERALGILQEWGPHANLLMVGFIKPHHPFDPPQELCALYDPEEMPVLPGWTRECFPHDLELSKGYFPHESLTEAALRRVTSYYYASIEHIDMQVGRIVDLLKRRGLYNDTLIIYTSDHGEYMGFHHLLLKGGYMYDPLVRVPLIIKYPAQQQCGSVSRALVSNIDVAPTILGQAGCAPGKQMHGLDLARGGRGREFIFAESGRDNQLMARTHTHKLITVASEHRAFFYDLGEDPFETRNRYGDPGSRAEAEELGAALKEWRGGRQDQDVYLDENAPVVDQPNVPPRTPGYREPIIEYFRGKMGEQSPRR